MTIHTDDLIEIQETAYGILYLYIALAIADGNIQEPEIACIQEKVSSDEKFMLVDVPALIEQIIRRQRTQSPEEIEQALVEYCQQVIVNEDDKRQLLVDLEDIMECDGVVKAGELSFCRNILGLLA